MSGYRSDAAYWGQEKIVISMDIGTTQSGVSFLHLTNGAKPVVNMVTEWPGQVYAAGFGKIPTLVAYFNGRMHACGEEAVEAFEDDKSTVAHYFKLHLHPDHMRRSLRRPIPPLPAGVTLEQAYCDIMSYMFMHTQAFFESRPGYLNTTTWHRLRRSMEIILTTPNGWDLREQAFLRKVAVNAGLVDQRNADAQVTFVTEAEASIHFALHHGTVKNWLKKGVMFAVVDAGGSTVDSTLYVCKSSRGPVHLEEVCSSKCVQAGGIFVDEQAGIMLKRKFQNSRFNIPAYHAVMIREFERKTKRLFEADKQSNIIQFGGPVDNDPSVGVRRGRVSLSAAEVASCFAVPMKDIMDSVRSLIETRKVKFLVLVGGFGESPYLRQQLKLVFGKGDRAIVVAEEPSRKAAAEGASIWHLTRDVKARAVRYTYGCNMDVEYDNTYRERMFNCYTDASGVVRVPGAFSPWVIKETVLEDNFYHELTYHLVWEPNSTTIWSDLCNRVVYVYICDALAAPLWILDAQGNPMPGARHLCTVTANLSGLYSELTLQYGLDGRQYYSIVYYVLVALGGTELSARIRWYQGGVPYEGPATIIPDAFTR